MSQYAAELCTLLVADTFGELYSTIVSYLLRHGRQPLARIARNTSLSGVQARHGLALLVQQHLVFHSTALEDGITYYECNWKAVYYLARWGKMIELVESGFGPFAARAMGAIIYLGHAKVSYLESLPELGMDEAGKMNGDAIDGDGTKAEHDVDDDVNGKGAAPNGTAQHHAPAVSGSKRLHTTLRTLVAHGLVMRVRDSHFASPGDLREHALAMLRARPDIRALKGKKQDEAIEAGIEVVVKERVDGKISGPVPEPLREGAGLEKEDGGEGGELNGEEELRGEAMRGIKRKGDDGADVDHSDTMNGDSDGPRHKKARTDAAVDMATEGDADDYWEEDADSPMDPNLILRPNMTKLDVLLRNRRLVAAAAAATSSTTATVYAALLARVATRTDSCRATEARVPEGEEAAVYSVPVSLLTVSEDIGPDVDLGGAFGKPPGVLLPDDATPNWAYEVDQHLSLLAQEPHYFCARRSSAIVGPSDWQVEFRHLARMLRHIELERLTAARFGPVAVRLVRILRALGKLDEKTLAERALVAARDLRTLLGGLTAAGLVGLQEVPRDSGAGQRTPARTIYLWFVDDGRVADVLIEDCYKAMARVLRRMAVERGRVRGLLDKASRSDVRGREEEFLTEVERAMLAEWQAREDMLLGEVMRLDEVVAVLRDY